MTGSDEGDQAVRDASASSASSPQRAIATLSPLHSEGLVLAADEAMTENEWKLLVVVLIFGFLCLIAVALALRLVVFNAIDNIISRASHRQLLLDAEICSSDCPCAPSVATLRVLIGSSRGTESNLRRLLSSTRDLQKDARFTTTLIAASRVDQNSG